jgi:protein-S-isoprenylcysteine O-methyltransferase Ste14
MKRDFEHVARTFARWALISSTTSALLFACAGTTQLFPLRLYLATFCAVLLVTMLAVTPQLARERAHPARDATPQNLRFVAGFLFLLTLGTASFSVGHLPALEIPTPIRGLSLATFVLSSSLQLWAMISNPFFSPVIRIQNEHKHVVIESGPYQFVRHPGYLAMVLSVPASALAIGSWLGLVPAVPFVLVISYRAQIEDAFLRNNLAGYAEYAQHVPSGLPFRRST